MAIAHIRAAKVWVFSLIGAAVDCLLATIAAVMVNRAMARKQAKAAHKDDLEDQLKEAAQKANAVWMAAAERATMLGRGTSWAARSEARAANWLAERAWKARARAVQAAQAWNTWAAARAEVEAWKAAQAAAQAEVWAEEAAARVDALGVVLKEIAAKGKHTHTG
jgi:hypothetical protein